MSRIAAVVQAAAVGKGNLESALPGEWTMLALLVVMTAVLGAAVLAGGVVRHQRLVARRTEQREAYEAAYRDAYREAESNWSGVDDLPRGRECG